MKRIQTANRAVDLFGPGRDGFRSAVPGVSEPTYLDAAWFNAVQEALVRVIEAAGIALDGGDFDQFSRALGQLFVGQSFVGRLANSNSQFDGSALIGHRASTVQAALDTLLEKISILGQAQSAGVIGIRKRCTCGKASTSRQLSQYGRCVACVRSVSPHPIETSFKEEN